MYRVQTIHWKSSTLYLANLHQIWLQPLGRVQSRSQYLDHSSAACVTLVSSLQCRPRHTASPERQPGHPGSELSTSGLTGKRVYVKTACYQITHWAFMMAIYICFWEATFGYKSYHLSDCYQLYISCKNNIRKAWNYQTDLSDLYQLYISCKINIETPITLSNRYETIRSIFFTTVV